ncbi:MAG: hypothetical protein COA39_003440 [Sulfurimonas sp.]|nr:hypothetical protein [Sulfurimonas sp.]
MDERYESQELQEWKKLSQEEQFSQVQALSTKYIEQLEPIFVRDQSIRVAMHIPKSAYYETLVDYEKYLRENLGNIPLIVLVEEKADENKRRQ